MNADQANPRIEKLMREVEEDLTPCRVALRTLGRPASATEVATEIARATGVAITALAARRRLERLVSEHGQARKTRATHGARPFLYELVPPTSRRAREVAARDGSRWDSCRTQRNARRQAASHGIHPKAGK